MDDFAKNIVRAALQKKHAAITKKYVVLGAQLEAINEELYELDRDRDLK